MIITDSEELDLRLIEHSASFAASFLNVHLPTYDGEFLNASMRVLTAAYNSDDEIWWRALKVLLYVMYSVDADEYKDAAIMDHYSELMFAISPFIVPIIMNRKVLPGQPVSLEFAV